MNIKEESYFETKTNSPISSEDSSPKSYSASSSSLSYYENNNTNTNTNSQMLFNQQNYFDANYAHHHHHQDYAGVQIPPILNETSLLTFQSGLGHMGHYNYDTNLIQQNSSFSQAKLSSPVSSSSVSPSIKTETDEKKPDSEDTSSSTDSASASSTPFQPAQQHDSTIIPPENNYNYNYQNQYNSAQNRLSVCLKYNPTSDQLNQIAAAAVAAVVSNTVPGSSGVPSSSSSSSSISMEDYSDGSPQSHYLQSQFNNVPRGNLASGYSPNSNLVGFYNNLENSTNYYANQQKNLNISSSSSSSSSSYQARDSSDYFPYQNYLANHCEQSELINAAQSGYPLQSSSPSLNQFSNHLSQFNALDQQYLQQNFVPTTNSHLPVINSYNLTPNSTNSRRCSPESSSSSSNSSSFAKASQFNSRYNLFFF